MPTPHTGPKGRRSGFALLITITLLAFLVLLLVSLAALTRVETQVASNNQQLSQARQNALMALNVAIGKLQAAAGPDQRITATADFDSAADPANRHWTGVWDSKPGSATYGERLTWLVSGTTPDVAVPVPDPSANPTASVRLIGEGSADLSTPAASAQNRVDVPLEEIVADDVPGLGNAPGGHVVGRFGYWVGDEGVKAKVTLGDPWKNATTAVRTATSVSTTDADTFSFFGAQRVGIEGISSLGTDTSTENKVGAAYPASTDADFRLALPKVLSLPQLSLSPSPNQASLNTAIKNRFHDLTASSRSLLTDVSAGGLKRDLSNWIRRPADSPSSSDFIPLSSRYSGFPANELYTLPKWGIIRSYAEIVADGSAKSATPQTDKVQGVFPVMTFSQLGLSASCAGAGSPLQIHLFPHVVLWNPYNVPITGSFEFCFGFPYNPKAYFRVGSGSSPTATKSTIYLGNTTLVNSPSGNPALPHAYFRFRVDLPAVGIAPGQSLAFTLKNTLEAYNAGNNVMSADDESIHEDASVTIQGPVIAAADYAQNGFFTLDSGNVDMLLCPLPTSATAPTSTELVASAYQIFRFGEGYGRPWTTNGYGGYDGDAYVPMGPVSGLSLALNPAYAYRISTNFSRNQGGEMPRWLANMTPRAGLMLRKRSNVGYTLAYPGCRVPTPVGVENSAGPGPNPGVVGGTVVRPVIAEFQPSNIPLFSLAQLQHAGLSLINLYPNYAVGNSSAEFYVARDQTSIGVGADPADKLRRIYDISYLLNEALWDRYFFSTIPDTLTSAAELTADYHLPNSRHDFYWRTDAAEEFDEVRTTDTAAAHLFVNGGFNVNSTSIQAWRALLYSHNSAPPSGQPDAKHPFSRFVRPVGTPNSPWEGYRVLTDTQIDNLAANIVKQIKARGPFLSLADFVNRRLIDIPSTTEDERLKGTLQAAIDSTDNIITDSSAPYSKNVNFVEPFRKTDSLYRIVKYASSNVDSMEKYRGGPDVDAPYASAAAFVPGFLTQADLLNAIGPVLAPRSDTFIIRAYGDVQNPATNTIDGRAWCEAVVQRLPDYVESGVNAWTTPAAGSPSDTFGRRFKIISFRWLNSSDI